MILKPVVYAQLCKSLEKMAAESTPAPASSRLQALVNSSVNKSQDARLGDTTVGAMLNMPKEDGILTAGTVFDGALGAMGGSLTGAIAGEALDRRNTNKFIDSRIARAQANGRLSKGPHEDVRNLLRAGTKPSTWRGKAGRGVGGVVGGMASLLFPALLANDRARDPRTEVEMQPPSTAADVSAFKAKVDAKRQAQ